MIPVADSQLAIGPFQGWRRNAGEFEVVIISADNSRTTLASYVVILVHCRELMFPHPQKTCLAEPLSAAEDNSGTCTEPGHSRHARLPLCRSVVSFHNETPQAGIVDHIRTRRESA